MHTSLINSFKNYLQQLGYGKTSCSMLPACTQEFLQVQQISSLQQIKPRHILLHYHYLQQRPNRRRAGALSEQHIQHHLYSLKVFFAWLEQIGQLQQNPISSLRFATPKQEPRQLLSQSEIEQLYAVAENSRERALLGLFYGCGLRRSEAQKLDLRDVQLKSNLLYVREGKGAKRRVVPVSAKVKQHLQEYLEQERSATAEETAFMLNSKGKRISGNSCNKLLKQLLERAGIQKPISLHSLRHSIASHLLERGLSLEYVRDFLGHLHLESTQIYTRVSQEQLQALSGS
jgi:integrase/recombinase XerD